MYTDFFKTFSDQTEKNLALTTKEQEMCDSIGPILRQKGLFLAGIDVIDGFLTEINVTSPTGIRAINALNECCLESLFWDRIVAIRHGQS